MSNSNYPFEYPLISGVMVYENITNWKYIPANLSQCYVKNTDNYLDEYGNIRTIISTSKNIRRSIEIICIIFHMTGIKSIL